MRLMAWNRVYGYIFSLEMMMIVIVGVGFKLVLRFVGKEVCEVEVLFDDGVGGVDGRVLLDFNKLFYVHSISYLY